MSILIKGMEMPVDCHDCELPYVLPNCPCYEKTFVEYWNDKSISLCRHPRCPLVSVPPHGDLIDRDPFIEFIKTHWDSYDQWFVEQLEARPTIIPAEEGE